MSETHPTCETCRFWVPPSTVKKSLKHGQCHVRSQPVSEIGNRMYFFPPREPDDWCGEHTSPTGPLVLMDDGTIVSKTAPSQPGPSTSATRSPSFATPPLSEENDS